MIPNFASSGAWVLRSFGGMLAAVPKLFTSSGGGSRRSMYVRPSLFQTALCFVTMLFVPMLLLGAIALAMHYDSSSGVALAGTKLLFADAPVATPKKPANIRQLEQDFKALAKELEIGQTEMANGPIPKARGEELEQKAKEMEEIQERLDSYNRIAGIVKKSREIESPTMPTDRSGNVKTVRTTMGHLFVGSEAFRQYRAQGKQGWSAKVELKGRPGRLVTLRGEEAVAFEAKAFNAAQLSDLGADAIIEVDRDREIIRYEEPEILTMRDVLNVIPTQADSIRFVRHTRTVGVAANGDIVEARPVAKSQASRGAAKPYLRIDFEPETVNVETIAVLSKVTEQDVDDAPRLVGMINGEMSLDVRVEEERQILWGSGAGGELDGLFNQAIPEFNRAEAGDTVIDTIRKMRTDLRKKRVQPNFVTVDPIDWEEVELTKGTDERYVWGLITDLRGPRIWSLRVVESDGMTNLETGERRILMGDGVRGATLYDRNDVRLAIGYVDDDFARNLRTLRAEERLALAVKRLWAFEYVVTAAGES